MLVTYVGSPPRTSSMRGFVTLSPNVGFVRVATLRVGHRFQRILFQIANTDRRVLCL